MFYQKILKASQTDTVDLEGFVRMLFDDDPTQENWSDEIWSDILPLLRDKLPERDFTVSVSKAAELKMCTPGAVRKAIERGDLTATKNGKFWRIDKQSLDQWYPGKQGGRLKAHAHKVSLHFGRSDKVYFGVRVDGLKVPDATQLDELTYKATIDKWSSIGVYTTTKHGRRYFKLVPSNSTNTIKLDDFYIEGQFDVEEKINNDKKSDVAWKAYRKE